MLPDEVTKQIDKKNWVGVIVLLAITIVSVVWFKFNDTQKDKDIAIADCARIAAKRDSIWLDREDRNNAKWQARLDAKDLKFIEQKDELIRRFDQGMMRIQPEKFKKLYKQVDVNTKEIQEIGKIKNDKP